MKSQLTHSSGLPLVPYVIDIRKTTMFLNFTLYGAPLQKFSVSQSMLVYGGIVNVIVNEGIRGSSVEHWFIIGMWKCNFGGMRLPK